MCTLGADVEGGAAAAPASVSMKELLSNKGVFIGCMIFLLQQFSGVNSVVYFSSSVFAKVRDQIFGGWKSCSCSLGVAVRSCRRGTG